MARLRIENKLLSEIKNGRYDPSTKRCQAGGLGTWAEGIASHFILRDELIATLLRKLESSDRGEQAYVFRYFMHLFPTLLDAPPRRYIRVMRAGLQSGNKLFRDGLEAIQFLVAGEEDPWLAPFVEDFQNFAEGSEAILTEDDIRSERLCGRPGS